MQCTEKRKKEHSFLHASDTVCTLTLFETLLCPMRPTTPLATNHHVMINPRVRPLRENKASVLTHLRSVRPWPHTSCAGPQAWERNNSCGCCPHPTRDNVAFWFGLAFYTKLFDWLSRLLGQLYFSKLVYGTCDSVPWRSRQTYAHGCITLFFFHRNRGGGGGRWWSGATVGKRNFIRPMTLSRQWHYNLRVPRLLFLPAFSRRKRDDFWLTLV